MTRRLTDGPTYTQKERNTRPCALNAIMRAQNFIAPHKIDQVYAQVFPIREQLPLNPAGLVEREGLINSVHGLKQNSQTFLSLIRHESNLTNSQLQIRQLFTLKRNLPRPCEQQNIPQLRFSPFSAPETAQTGRGQEISWEGA